MDFKSFPPNKKDYNNVYVMIDRLRKRAYSIPYYKTTTIKNIAQLFISNIYRTHEPLDIIILDRGP